MELIFIVVSCTVPCFGCVTQTALLTRCAWQRLHGAKAFSAPHFNTQWGVGCGQGAGEGTAGAADLRDGLCCTRSCSAIKTGDGEGRCSGSLLLGEWLGINWLVVIAFSLLVFPGFVSIFSPLIYKTVFNSTQKFSHCCPPPGSSVETLLYLLMVRDF